MEHKLNQIIQMLDELKQKQDAMNKKMELFNGKLKNEPKKCGCGMTKSTEGYCDGSHKLISELRQATNKLNNLHI